jgi:hypothetical protein
LIAKLKKAKEEHSHQHRDDSDEEQHVVDTKSDDSD